MLFRVWCFGGQFLGSDMSSDPDLQHKPTEPPFLTWSLVWITKRFAVGFQEQARSKALSSWMSSQYMQRPTAFPQLLARSEGTRKLMSLTDLELFSTADSCWKSNNPPIP
ncbi:uncharacterized protein ACIQIH_007021 isoform 2-T2 [Cyanocitta cristata]